MLAVSTTWFPTPDYYNGAYRRYDDPEYEGSVLISAWDYLGYSRRQLAEIRWGFYTPEPLPIKRRNQHRPLVPTMVK